MIKPRDKADSPTSEQKKLEKITFKKSLAKSVKEARKDKGYKQQDLAALADLDLSYISHLERGIYIPTSYVLWKIARALGITLSDLTKDI